MATQTQTLRRPAIQQERVHDYLYAPTHNLSSERDHARATFKAHTGTDRVKRVPVYNTMFSELRHHPRFQMKLDVTDPVPKFVSRQWRGYNEQAREALVRYTTFNYDPSVKIPSKSYPEAKVTGQNRYQFFRRPIIPFLQQVPPDVRLASARQDPLMGAGGLDQIEERPPTPPYKTTMTQTDYRDSEAQTDPFTPEYVVRPGSQPELLTLATLSYGHGLPAGLAEVEMIERARAKREWEATLPALNDVSQLEKRRKMMDEMERNEWALRETEIEKLQEARLEVLQKLLRQREEHHQEMNTKRLDRLWAKKQEEKETRVKKIRSEHIKAIRKLTRKRKSVEGKLERRDVVKDYSDHASQSYAPLTRIGVFLDRGSEQYVVKSRYLNTYQGLLELESSLPDFVTAPRIKAPKPKTSTKAGFVKRKYRQEKELNELHQVIKENREKVLESPKPLRFLEKIEKPVPRPPTPSVEVPSEEEEEQELAIIFLQQLLRGRAIQNMMFEGKEKRKDLIRELRSTHALQEAEQQVQRQEKQATLALQRQRRLHEHKESHVDEAISQVEGTSLGDTLDFLSKELIRIQEERRIHAFSMLAERQRRIREAEESGRRQVEERRRREEDELFKQVVKIHQMTVDTYLEDVILLSIDNTADRQARLEVQEKATKINDIAYDIENRRTHLESEEIVSEMVHGFLLPEVQRKTIREKVHNQQRKYLVAAHREVCGPSQGIIDMYPRAAVPKPQTPQETAPAAKDNSSAPGSTKNSRPTSAAKSMGGSIKGSRPASVAGSTKSGSGSTNEAPGSAAGSMKGSRPGSAAGSTKSASGSNKGSRSGSEAGSVKDEATGSGSRPGSAAGSVKEAGSTSGSTKGSRPGSAAGSVKEAGSTSGSTKGSRPGSAAGSVKEAGSTSSSTKGSRPASAAGSVESAAGSVKDEAPGSASGSRKGSRPGSAAGSVKSSRPPSAAGSTKSATGSTS